MHPSHTWEGPASGERIVLPADEQDLGPLLPSHHYGIHGETGPGVPAEADTVGLGWGAGTDWRALTDDMDPHLGAPSALIRVGPRHSTR